MAPLKTAVVLYAIHRRRKRRRRRRGGGDDDDGFGGGGDGSSEFGSQDDSRSPDEGQVPRQYAAGGPPGPPRVWIKTHGLRELQRDLRQLDTILPRELRQAGLRAADIVAAEAQARARSQGGVAAKSAPAIKPFAEQRRFGVRLDSSQHPYAFGAEFGSIQHRQFKPWRGNQWTDPPGRVGYYLHPAITDGIDEVLRTYERAIDALIKRAFPL